MTGKNLLDTENLKLQVEELETMVEAGNYEQAVKNSQNLSNRRIRDVIISIPRENILPFLRELGWKRTARIAAWLPEELTIELLEEMEETVILGSIIFFQIIGPFMLEIALKKTGSLK